jgi:hypothetical protein
LGGLMVSKTIQQARDYWDVVIAQHDSPAVQNRLLALRDLITEKLGA